MDYNSLNLRELTVFDLLYDEKYLNDYFPWGKEAYIREPSNIRICVGIVCLV